MTTPTDVLCAGIIVADHVSSPIAHLPAAGELVLADQLLLTIGGCAANVAVDLVKLGVNASVVGRVGDDVFGRVVAEMLRERGVGVKTLRSDAARRYEPNADRQRRRAGSALHSHVRRQRPLPGDGHSVRAGRTLQGAVPGRLSADARTPGGRCWRAVFATARQAGAKTVLDVVTPGPGRLSATIEAVVAASGRISAQQSRGGTHHRRDGSVAAGGAISSTRCENGDHYARRRRRRAGQRQGTTAGGDVCGSVCGRQWRRRRLRGRLHFGATARSGRGGLSAAGQRRRGELRPCHRHDDRRLHGAECEEFVREQPLRIERL